MLDSLWYHKQLSGTQYDIPAAHLNRHSPLEHEEEVIRVVMFVPNKRAFHFDDHEIVPIELTDGSWLPMLCKRRECFRQVDGIQCCASVDE